MLKLFSITLNHRLRKCSWGTSSPWLNTRPAVHCPGVRYLRATTNSNAGKKVVCSGNRVIFLEREFASKQCRAERREPRARFRPRQLGPWTMPGCVFWLEIRYGFIFTLLPVSRKVNNCQSNIDLLSNDLTIMRFFHFIYIKRSESFVWPWFEIGRARVGKECQY